MSKRNGLIKTHVEIEFPANVDLREIQQALDGGLHDIALKVEGYAKASTAFADRTGKLRRKIKAKPHPDGDGYIVEARSPNAHLVENGHAQVTRDGRTVGYTAARPFLGPAAELGMNEAIKELS